MTKPRTFTLKDIVPASVAYGSACRQANRTERPTASTPGPAGEILPKDGFEGLDGAREWLKQLDAGRLG